MRRIATPLLLLGVSAGLNAAVPVCHLHAPADHPTFSSQPLVIPDVGAPADCDALNRGRFAGSGRCHCVADRLGTGQIEGRRWSSRPSASPEDPGDSPFQ